MRIVLFPLLVASLLAASCGGGGATEGSRPPWWPPKRNVDGPPTPLRLPSVSTIANPVEGAGLKVLVTDADVRWANDMELLIRIELAIENLSLSTPFSYPSEIKVWCAFPTAYASWGGYGYDYAAAVSGKRPSHSAEIKPRQTRRYGPVILGMHAPLNECGHPLVTLDVWSSGFGEPPYAEGPQIEWPVLRTVTGIRFSVPEATYLALPIDVQGLLHKAKKLPSTMPALSDRCDLVQAHLAEITGDSRWRRDHEIACSFVLPSDEGRVSVDLNAAFPATRAVDIQTGSRSVAGLPGSASERQNESSYGVTLYRPDYNLEVWVVDLNNRIEIAHTLVRLLSGG